MGILTKTWVKIQKSPNIVWKLALIMLLPLSCIYLVSYIIVTSYQKLHTKKVEGFVICLGNAIIGGGGKTPVALALGKYLKQQNVPAAYILRGYGGALSNKYKAVKVNPELHQARDVGDEALLLAAELPTYISGNRYLAASYALKEGAKVILMDDGMQNFTLHQDKVICIFTNSVGIGNGLLFPSGGLREPLGWACKRSHKIIIIDDMGGREMLDCFASKPQGYQYKISRRLKSIFNFLFKNLDLSKPNNTIHIVSLKSHVSNLDASKSAFIGLVGIAHPEKFILTAQKIGIELAHCYQFPDHYPYKDNEIEEIYQEALNNKYQIITTSKDLVRIPAKYHKSIALLEIEVVVPEEVIREIIPSAFFTEEKNFNKI